MHYLINPWLLVLVTPLEWVRRGVRFDTPSLSKRKFRSAVVERCLDLWSEDPTRELNNQISELQARVAFPQHWSSGEHELNVERLRQLNYQKRLLSDYTQK